MTHPAHLHIVCPHCDKTNRVPTQRLSEAPQCGACGRPVFVGETLTLTTANFAPHAERSDLPIVVDFWAAWCGPCRMMAPAFAEAARRCEPRARFGKVDTEAEPALSRQFAIRSIPTLVVLSHGKEIARQSGAMSADQLTQWVRPYLISPTNGS